MHNADDLIRLFNQTFKDYKTVLVRGDDEPLYQPSQKIGVPHQIIFAHGFYASALHEIAHWCIAGAKRRELVDFGYWYEPDGRSAAQQKEFEVVEVKPQAVEWALSLSAGFNFRVSVDNLGGESVDWRAFQRKVFSQLVSYHEQGFPARAQCFMDVLSDFYQQPNAIVNAITQEQTLLEG